MKQFSILSLFGVMTLAAVACGVFCWFGWNAYGFLLCGFAIGGPLAGSTAMIRWSESINAPRNAFIGGVIGGAGGYLTVCLSLAATIGGIPLRPELWGSIFLIWLFGLVISFAYGGMVGVVIAAGWATVKWMIAVAAPKNQQVE